MTLQVSLLSIISYNNVFLSLGFVRVSDQINVQTKTSVFSVGGLQKQEEWKRLNKKQSKMYLLL